MDPIKTHEALMNCCDEVRTISRANRRQQVMITDLKRELKGEKQLRKKAESYIKELEGFLAQEGENNVKKK